MPALDAAQPTEFTRGTVGLAAQHPRPRPEFAGEFRKRDEA